MTSPHYVDSTMQAIETETGIAPDGNIHLPDPLRAVYGRHARSILLFEEMPAHEETSAAAKLRSLKGGWIPNGCARA